MNKITVNRKNIGLTGAELRHMGSFFSTYAQFLTHA